jgi:amino acid transporter
LIRLVTGSLSVMSAPMLPEGVGGVETLTTLLVLRAFASGCAAMTGVEAISNGVPAFQKPEADNAGKTLIVMATLLGVMFLGITFLARALSIVPIEQERDLATVDRCSGRTTYLASGTTSHSRPGRQHGVRRFPVCVHPGA